MKRYFGVQKIFLTFAVAIFLELAGVFSVQADSICPLPTGNAYKTSTSSITVFFIKDNCEKVTVKDKEKLYSYLNSPDNIKVSNTRTLRKVKNSKNQELPWGSNKKFLSGTILKPSNSANLYLLLDSKLYQFANKAAIQSLGMKTSWIESAVPDVFKRYDIADKPISIKNYPEALVFSYPNKKQLYKLEYNDQGVPEKRIISAPSVLKDAYRADRIAVFSKKTTWPTSTQPPIKTSMEFSDFSTETFSSTPVNYFTQTPATTITNPIVIAPVPSPTSPWSTGGSPYYEPSATVVSTVNLSLTNTPNSAATTPSTTVLFTLAYTNTGNATASGVSITETVPTNTIFSSSQSTGTWSCPNESYGGTTCTATIGSVAANASASVIFAITPSSSYSGSFTNNASITDNGTYGADTDTANNSASSGQVTISGNPNLSITMTVNSATSTASSTIVYSLNYHNVGTIDSSGVVITGTVSSGTLFSATTSTASWSCADGAVSSTVCTYTVGNVGINASGTILFALDTLYSSLNGWTTTTVSLADDATHGTDSNVLNNTATTTVRTMMVPIMDMGSLTYLKFDGGLYGGGSNTAPTAHDTAAKAAAAAIRPLDGNGNSSATGKVVLMSIGMSNNRREFNAFASSTTDAVLPATNTTTVSSSLVVITGAIESQAASTWINSTDVNYDRVSTTLQGYSLAYGYTVSSSQVQAIWLKNTDTGATRSLVNGAAADAYTLETNLGQTVRALKIRYPNLKLVFVTSRAYGGYAGSGALSPEPYAYENGFAFQWLVKAQINQMANGGTVVDTRAGDLNYNNGTAPVIVWGPYIWANGMIENSQGTTWAAYASLGGQNYTGDFINDQQHPSPLADVNHTTSGVKKVSDLLGAFFHGSAYSTPWFNN